MSRQNAAKLRNLDMNEIEFQQDTVFSDEDSLEEFKMKAKKLIKSAFNTPTRRDSKSIIHTGKNSSLKSVKFNQVKIEKDGDCIYVSEIQQNGINPEVEGSISQQQDSKYFSSANTQNTNKKQKKLLVTQRDSILSSQQQSSSKGGSFLSTDIKYGINQVQPFDISMNQNKDPQLNQYQQLNQSFDAYSYYSSNIKNPQINQSIEKRRCQSAKQLSCEQEIDIHNFYDPEFVKQKQIDKFWYDSHGKILSLEVVNKYQCRLDYQYSMSKNVIGSEKKKKIQ